MFNKRAVAFLALFSLFGVQACMPNMLARQSSQPDLTPSQENIYEQEITEMAVAEPLLLSPDLNAQCAGEQSGDTYRMGPKDTLLFTIFGQKDVSGEYTIDDTGTISFPLIGEVLLSGCSIREAEILLTDLYADGYFVNPSISVEISKFRPFYILGEVRVPGQYDFSVDTDILKAVAIAGGFTYRANKKEAKVLRRDVNGRPYYSMETFESDIRPGDVIIVRERFF